MCEVLASRLASYFGLSVPEPAIIVFEREFSDLVVSLHARDDRRAAAVGNSAGLNFGTRLLVDMSTWPVDKFVPDAMWQQATNIFAFDALVQNPDRPFSNPNLFTRGNDIVLFDHELAFSFLLDILGSETPWLLDEQRYLTDHVFYRKLKSKKIDLTEFTRRLATLMDAVWEDILEDVPVEWNNENVPRVERHLRVMSEHAREFAEEVRRRLA